MLFRSTVSLAAPGSSILSTVPGGYDTYSGTSMATPFVSGVASLVAAHDPGLTARQLVQRVLATVRPLPALANRVATGGLVNAYNALTGRVVSRQAARAAGLPATTRLIGARAPRQVQRQAAGLRAG